MGNQPPTPPPPPPPPVPPMTFTRSTNEDWNSTYVGQCGAAPKYLMNAVPNSFKITDLSNVEITTAGYITPAGTLRKYNNGKLSNTTNTCPTAVSTTSQTLLSAIAAGDPMTETTPCGFSVIPPEQQTNLSQLNGQLLEMAQKIFNRISNLKKKLDTSANASDEMKQQLADQLKVFQARLQELQMIDTTDTTFETRVGDIAGEAEASNRTYYLLITMIIVLVIASSYLLR